MRTVLILVVIFLITQYMAIFSGMELRKEKVKVIEEKKAKELTTAFELFLYVLIATFILFLILKFRKYGVLKLFEAFAIVLACFYALFPIFRDLAFPLSFLIVWLKHSRKSLFWKNIASILSSAGIASLFGSNLSFQVCTLFLVVMSLYDFFAVLVTKHLAYMAREVVKFKWQSFTVTIRDKRRKRGALDLGAGDLALPAMFSVASHSVIGPKSLILPLFSSFGLLLLIIVPKRERPLPALPLITSFLFFGFFLLHSIFY